MAMNWPRPYDTAPARNASAIRNSEEVSSTPMSADELNSVRAIVLAKISTTSIASATFSSTMTARSTALTQRGTLHRYSAALGSAIPRVGVTALKSIHASSFHVCVRSGD